MNRAEKNFKLHGSKTAVLTGFHILPKYLISLFLKVPDIIFIIILISFTIAKTVVNFSTVFTIKQK